MLDAVNLETMGVPTVTFVVPAFLEAARAHARMRGIPDLRFVVIPNDYMSETDEQIAAKIEVVFYEVVEDLTVGP